MVGVVNPCLVQYGHDVERKLAAVILTLIVAKTVIMTVVYHNNTKVTIQLMDQSACEVRTKCTSG